MPEPAHSASLRMGDTAAAQTNLRFGDDIANDSYTSLSDLRSLRAAQTGLNFLILDDWYDLKLFQNALCRRSGKRTSLPLATIVSVEERR